MADNSLKFTQKLVDSLPLFDATQSDSKKNYEMYWDTKLSGFGVRATKSKKSFVYVERVNGKPVWLTIGNCGNLNLEDARKKAKEKTVELSSGINPNKKVKEETYTLINVFHDFLRNRDLKPRTIKDYKQNFGIWETNPGKNSKPRTEQALEGWKDKKIQDITGEMVADKYKELVKKKGKAQASGAMRILRAILNFAEAKYEDSKGEPVIKRNPVKKLNAVAGKKWNKIKRRKTYIKDEDLPSWYEALLNLKGEKGRDYILLILLSGLRRMEPASLEWDRDVDMERKGYFVDDPKNSERLALPMTKEIFKIFQRRLKARNGSRYVFPGQSGAKLGNPQSWVDQVSKTVKFCLHDLRRMFITRADKAKIPHYAHKALVNHSFEDDPDVTTEYIVNIDDPNKYRQEAQQIENEILKVCRLKN